MAPCRTACAPMLESSQERSRTALCEAQAAQADATRAAGAQPTGMLPPDATPSSRRSGRPLPPGWRRIPVVGAGPVITDLLDEAFRGLPRDSYAPHRAHLQRVLDEQVTAAQAHHGIDLYLPTAGVRGRPVAASFVVSHLPMP